MKVTRGSGEQEEATLSRRRADHRVLFRGLGISGPLGSLIQGFDEVHLLHVRFLKLLQITLVHGTELVEHVVVLVKVSLRLEQRVDELFPFVLRCVITPSASVLSLSSLLTRSNRCALVVVVLTSSISSSRILLRRSSSNSSQASALSRSSLLSRSMPSDRACLSSTHAVSRNRLGGDGSTQILPTRSCTICSTGCFSDSARWQCTHVSFRGRMGCPLTQAFCAGCSRPEMKFSINLSFHVFPDHTIHCGGCV